MSFLLSKIFWFAVQPINFLLLLIALGALLLFTRFQRMARMLVVLSAVFGLIIAHSPLPNLLLLPLEDRFARPVLPDDLAGIISLGGGVDVDVTASRGHFEIESAADRVTELIILGRRFPDAKLVYTGGASNVVYGTTFGENAVRGFIESFGIESERLLIETVSKNTVQNATETRKLVEPKPGEKWLLITSAFHMPRAMGTFRKNGWEVIPWPVDYRTRATGNASQFFFSAILHIENMNLAVKEYIGLVAYWLAGRSQSLFPGPEEAGGR